MAQAELWRADETFFLTHLEIYNWGGFNGFHTADIDAHGTAIIGPTGSGKTTLVDALMTLLCANPRYNLASSGGHESDRDLVSYVRGAMGPGEGDQSGSAIARSGKTITGFAAHFSNHETSMRIGALLWFDGSSSSASDMKKLWLLADAPEQSLQHWLTTHRDGGMRALRKLGKDNTGIWTYPSKKSYLARLRDYFDVGENAFTLLNRAAGLKQLNSLDTIFRDLVLDDRAAFDRAAEVANSFDDLRDIHEELDIAKRQQRALLPVATHWQQYQEQALNLEQQEKIKTILPIWYAEQAQRLWAAHEQVLQGQLQDAEQQERRSQSQVDQQSQQLDICRQAYMQAGGANIEQLKLRIADWQKTRVIRARDAKKYQQLVSQLTLPTTLTLAALKDNQKRAANRLDEMKSLLEGAEEALYSTGLNDREAKNAFAEIQHEKKDVENRPDSNLPPQFLSFRTELAQQLSLPEEQLPFAAELIQIRPEEQDWRGAIERAIGSHRLRILVPPAQMQAALEWVNQRSNRLHVRLLEVKEPDAAVEFMADGFTRKLNFKAHPYRQCLKAMLAKMDRHCVASVEQLRDTPHAMTMQGFMSGQRRFFDKQDQKRLDQGWCTGFDNRDRLRQLEQALQEAREHCDVMADALHVARQQLTALNTEHALLQGLQSLEFESVDLPSIDTELATLNAQWDLLVAPDSKTALIKKEMELAQQQLQSLERERQAAMVLRIGIEKDRDHAIGSRDKAQKHMAAGLDDQQRQLGEAQLEIVKDKQRNDLPELERAAGDALQQTLDAGRDKLNGLSRRLVQKMADAKKEDRGALSEVGRELEDIPEYLDRLRVLTEEALPEKLDRFLAYLNRSSDEGVTQLLSHINNEVSMIEERMDDLNETLSHVDFQPRNYLRLSTKKVIHESLRSLQRAQQTLNSARFNEDNGESQYQALQVLVGLLRDACDRQRTQGAKALLDPRYRLSFTVEVICRETGDLLNSLTSSQSGSGGEKEIIASFVLTASLSYALCPSGSQRPLFGTIVLDEAFSRSSQAVAGRIIAALKEFGLHAVFITPNKELRLLRNHTRSAIVVHRLGQQSSLTSLSWKALDDIYQRRKSVS